MNWRRWNLANDLLLLIAFSVLRSCWLWLWLEYAHRVLLPARPGQLFSIPQMMAVFLISAALTRLALAGKGELVWPRVGIAVAGLTAIPFMLWNLFFRAEYVLWDPNWLGSLGWKFAHFNEEAVAFIVVIFAVMYLWLQGVLDARSSIYNETAWRAFGSGFVAMTFPLVIGSLFKIPPPGRAVNTMLLFFAAAMGALAVTGLQRAGYGLEKGERQLPLRRYWLLSVAVVIAGLLAAGLLLSAAIEPESVARAFSWTSVILDVLGRLLYILLLGLSYVIFFFLEPLINWLRGLLATGSSEQKMELPDFQKQIEELTKDAPTRSIPVWGGFRWIGLALAIVLVGLIFAWALRRFWKGEEEGVEETRESVLSATLLKDQLSALVRNWLRRLRRAAIPILSPFLSLEGEYPTRRVVRAIYQALLAAAAERGQPRAPGQTPTEYRQALAEAFPESRQTLDVITEEYRQARYAPDPPTAEEAERAQQAWEQTQSALARNERQDGTP